MSVKQVVREVSIRKRNLARAWGEADLRVMYCKAATEED